MVKLWCLLGKSTHSRSGNVQFIPFGLAAKCSAPNTTQKEGKTHRKDGTRKESNKERKQTNTPQHKDTKNKQGRAAPQTYSLGRDHHLHLQHWKWDHTHICVGITDILLWLQAKFVSQLLGQISYTRDHCQECDFEDEKCDGGIFIPYVDNICRLIRHKIKSCSKN